MEAVQIKALLEKHLTEFHKASALAKEQYKQLQVRD